MGGFLYAFLFSIAAGVTTSATRWLLLDRLHHLTGIKRPRLDLGNLEERLHSFDRVLEGHYRYYEFYGGMLIATSFSYFLWRARQAGMALSIYDVLFLTLEVIFAMASRDTLRNYYGRAAQVLGTLDSEASMTNGIGHHEQVPPVTSSKRQTPKAPPTEKESAPRRKETKPGEGTDSRKK